MAHWGLNGFHFDRLLRRLLVAAVLAGLVQQAWAAPRINELMASNTMALVDEDGEASDWLEIHNPDAAPVSLDGWSLTDDAAVPDKWVLPDVTIPAGGYLVVFASDKDRRPTDGSPLHTNFKLTADGEYLGLYDNGIPRAVVSEFAPSFPRQRPDISYGASGGGSTAYLVPATPGGSNVGSTAFTGFLATPTFSVARGVFEVGFPLEMMHEDPAAEIRYTLNGSEPTASTGTPYAVALSINPPSDRGAVIVRAAAFRAGFLSSDVVTATYVFPDSALEQAVLPAGLPVNWGTVFPNIRTGDYQMDPNVVDDFFHRPYVVAGMVDLPIVSIVTEHAAMWDPATGIYMNPGASGSGWERAASFELIFSDGSDGYQQNCGIEIQGGSSTEAWKIAKLSFDLEFDGDFGPSGLDYPLFPDSEVESFETITLDGHSDLTWLHPGDGHRDIAQYVRDAYTCDVQLALGRPAPHSRFCNVYINGLYWGVYDAHEKPNAAFAAAYLGGAPGDYDVIKHNGSDVVDGDNASWNEMMAIARAGVESLEDYEALSELVDMASLADYMIANLYAANTDWPYHNWYAAKKREAGAKFHFFTWDAEHTIVYPLINFIESPHDVTDTVGELFSLVRGSAEFNLLFGDRAHRALAPGGALYVNAANPDWDSADPASNRPAAMYMKRIAEIDNAIACESARWGDNRRIANPYTRNAEWLAELDRLLEEFFPVRSAAVLDQFIEAGLYPTVGAPVYNQHGGEVPQGFGVSMSIPSGTSGTIHYTLDGSDPREYGTGAVSGGALTYSGAITITGPRLFKARTNSGGAWSALSEAQFVVVVPEGALEISEIQYNPSGGNDFEFIELHNTTSQALELSGLSFDQGITFSFPDGMFVGPNGYVVVAGNPAVFATRYPAVPTAGDYTGNLDNSGESVRLVDGLGRVVIDLDYDDADVWPIAPDGFGFTLVPAVAGAGSDGANWRASAGVHGSPGAADPVPLHGGVVVNEVLYASSAPLEDAIELHNPTAAAVDIGGWYLSDSKSSVANLKKYRIPAGTIIPAGGYRVFYENQFNAGGTPFALSSAGEAVYLTSADAGANLTGYLTETAFGAAEPGVSYGRVQTSPGVRRTFLASRTFGVDDPATVAEFRTGTGLANAGALIAPVVFNEVMYLPAEGGDPFIELRNRTGSPFPLYHVGVLRGWTIAGINNQAETADFEFGPGAGIPAYGFALVVRIDPALFRAAHSIPGDVPIYGPYGGVLDEDGERLELRKVTESSPGVAAFVLADEVRYAAGGAWPESPAGSGLSLERIFGNEYGDDPVNWAASAIHGGTPGSCNTVSLHFGDGDLDGDVDDDDLAGFADCETGAGGGPYLPQCAAFDFEFDGDVDTDDEAVLLAVYSPVGGLPGDANGDGLVALDDYDGFEACFSASGPEIPAPSGECLTEFDFDTDGDVDLADAIVFQSWFAQTRPYMPATCHAAR